MKGRGLLWLVVMSESRIVCFLFPWDCAYYFQLEALQHALQLRSAIIWPFEVFIDSLNDILVLVQYKCYRYFPFQTMPFNLRILVSFMDGMRPKN